MTDNVQVIEIRPQGVCAVLIQVRLIDNIVDEVRFLGGCAGNTQGVARLSKGKSLEELINALEGIQCGDKGTSCPDQFAKGLKNYLLEKSKVH